MLRRASHYIIQIIATSVLVSIGFIYMNGIPLIGIPKIEDVLYVDFASSRMGVTGRQFTEAQDIEKAIKMANFLKQTLRTPEQGDPIVELKLTLRDGDVFVLGVNEDTVFKDGKAYSLDPGADLLIEATNIDYGEK